MAFVGEFHRIADQIHDDLAQAPRIAAHQHRHFGVDVDDELDALGGGLQRAWRRPSRRSRRADRSRHSRAPAGPASIFERSSTSLIRDSSALALPRMMSTYSRCVLSRRGLREDLRHADHAIHGRADFVAHVREKIALGAVRRFRGELGVERGLLGEFAVGDELHRAGQPDGRAVRIALGLAAQPHPFVMPVLVPHAKFHVVHGAIASQMIVDRGARSRRSSGWIRLSKRLARGAELADAEAQQLLEARPEPEVVRPACRIPTRRRACRAWCAPGASRSS